MTRIWIACAVLGLASVAAAAPPSAPSAPSVSISAELKALGTRVLADLTRRYPDGLHGDAERGDIPATGPCLRPSAAQRATLKARVAPGVADDDVVSIAFGCLEPSGIIVNVAFDRVARDQHRTGIWRVLRASAATSTARLTTLADYSGLSTQRFMEWANEVTVSAIGLLDIDGDGHRDVVIARDAHEGGAQAHDVTLTLWRARNGKTSQLGVFHDRVALIAGFGGVPALLAIDRSGPDGSDPLRYHCVTTSGDVELCPVVAEARRVRHMAELAQGFAEGRYYPKTASARPDRDLLLEMLGELEVPPDEQLRLAAEVAETPPERRVEREIRRFLAPKLTRRFGEIVDEPVVESRPAQLAALLGDSLCTPVPARVAAEIAAWIRANDARALVEHGDCAARKRCRWARPSAPTLGGSCVAGTQGLVLASWSYTDGEARLARDAVFYLAPAITPLVTATTTSDEHDGNVAGGQISARWYRRGPSLVATIVDGSQAKPVMSLFVDGVRAATVPPDASWFGFHEPDAEAADLLQTSSRSSVTYWHHDGSAWQRVIEVPFETTAAQPTSASPAAQFLFEEAHRVFARSTLESLEPAKWRKDANLRAQTRRALVLAGADPAMLARIDAEAASLH